MEVSPNSSPTRAKPATLSPRSPVERPKPRKKKNKSSLSSFKGQRFYPPGSPETSGDSSKGRKSRSNLITWQEFVMDGFGPTMSLASLVSWQDMLSYSPPPHGGDGSSTPPEIRDALYAKKKRNTRELFVRGIQSLTSSKGKSSQKTQAGNITGRQHSSSPRNTGKPLVASFGKASTFSAGQKPVIHENSKRRRWSGISFWWWVEFNLNNYAGDLGFSIQSKSLSNWALRAKEFLSLKKSSSKKGKGIAKPSTQTPEYHSSSSSSGSSSPNPRRRLLARENTPNKITVRRASHQPEPISLVSPVSSASGSAVSITKPVSGWTFLAPPGQPPSPGNGLPTPPASLQPPAQLVLDAATLQEPPVPPMSPLSRHRSIAANPNEDKGPTALGNDLLEPRMSVADSTKSHETLWRRSMSSPSISSSYTSLSMPGGGSRHSSIWDYRGSIVSIPRGSIVSMEDAKRALLANLTGNLTHDSKAREETIHKRISDTPIHTHVNGMFFSSGHLAPFHMEPAKPDMPVLASEPEPEQQEPPPRRATIGERMPSIVKKDHMEIYSHPYFEVVPSERHRSLSSVTFGSRSRYVQRQSTMDSIGSFQTALDGTKDPIEDVSFASF
ncbi:hypothetical protein TWF730_010707 [Orbilia blumenaviensis]|uniref:Uncharacterized protein n=1 Tax=Orbilia blumenaviensis TaxID=1796055 RepID=A0AAV9UPG4_9PEZI